MRKPPTPAQQAATMRNWGIRNLHALFAQAAQLRPDRRSAVQRLINEELADRGAKPAGQAQEPP